MAKDPGELYIKYGEQNERILTLRWMLRRWAVRTGGENSSE
jgi:hypothetical protein